MSSIAITVPTNQDARYVAAFGDDIGPGVSATAAQIKASILAFAIAKVLAFEQRQAIAAAVASVTPIAPT